jgi:acyl-[acyl-carrier-protein]-phospholipid O-acyltransferase / long-chain-fatty-acid--[acyl-carrier-protein] ligase
MAAMPFDIQRTRMTLFDALLRARAKAGGKMGVLEDQDRKVLSYDDLIRAAFALGNKIKAFTAPKERVGVLLPSSAGAAVTVFALHAIGRVPAMLNFTAGALNLKAALEIAGIKTILTSAKFIEQGNLEPLAAELAKHAKLVKLEDVRASVGFFDRLGALIAGFTPARHAASGTPDDEAAILFTSGSFGMPRGVVLSHANLIANVEQVAAHIEFEPHWVFFNPLPVFHCFGLTGGMLLPLLRGHKAFLYPSPLHFKIIPKLVKESGASVLLATDTFAYQYARAADPQDMSDLAFIVCGAERVREETRVAYARRFKVPLLEGYGLTEASPVLSVNQPDANQHGTVGRVLPGIETRLEPVPGIDVGQRLFVRGPNVMTGYLTAPDTIERPEDGWHDTGDVVTMTADGFIAIEGRVKRFAKVGGEMVSLAAVESYASAVWPEHRHAAVALPCPRKGERVVLVSEEPGADPVALRIWAQSHGAPEIAIPKTVVAVAEIPVLGSGKTDYVAVSAIAETAEAEAA